MKRKNLMKQAMKSPIKQIAKSQILQIIRMMTLQKKTVQQNKVLMNLVRLSPQKAKMRLKLVIQAKS